MNQNPPQSRRRFQPAPGSSWSRIQGQPSRLNLNAFSDSNEDIRDRLAVGVSTSLLMTTRNED